MRHLTLDEVLALHVYLMFEKWDEPYYGVRDEGLLESAVSRPLQAEHYGEADLCRLAARLWEGITVNHPFVQGNKRTAYAAMEIFLRLNGHACAATDDEVISICFGLATGQIRLEEATEWLREHIAPCNVESCT